MRRLPKGRAWWSPGQGDAECGSLVHEAAAGSGAGRVALVLLVIPSGSAAVTYTLLATMAGVLVSPVAGAIADRADQRLLLLIGETGQGVIYAVTAALAGAAQAVAGAGNSADLVGTDTLLQQRVPAVLLGRAFSLVYGADQLAAMVSYGLAGPLVALAGPRAAFVVAGAGALTGLGVLVPGLRDGAGK
jgi:MFS family permease